MSRSLNPIERRILGVLIEKSLAQPQYYPMTINAITVACNQKNNRDPVMDLDEEAVFNGLEILRAAGLVSRVMPGGSSRVERYRHEAKDLLGWEKPQRAVMAELLLRGPQTLGELRGRCSRMHPFDAVDAVQAVLDILGQGDTQYVTMLPRAPGQSAARYAHQLYTEKEWQRLLSAEAGRAVAGGHGDEAAPADSTHAGHGAPAIAGHAGNEADAASGGAAQISDLKSQVAELRDEIEELRSQLAAVTAELADVRQRMDGA